jgi:hypothetical protein
MGDSMSTIINATTTNGVVIQPDNSGSLVLQTNSGTTALTIDTSQRAAFVAGTAAAPAITTTGDTNTGMWFPAADTIAFAEGGAESMRIDSSGNVLVGTTTVPSAGAKFAVVGDVSSGRLAQLNGTTTGDVANFAMSISKFDNNTTTSQRFIGFVVNNAATASGQINANGASAAAFGSFSDRRLKENITDLPSQLNNIMALRPVEFDYIESEGGGHQIGFIAQDVKDIYPDLVGEREDGMFTLTDMNKNDARLIKCIQEQQTIINDLKARVTALEAK